MVAITDPDVTRGQQRAAEFGVPAVYSNLQQLLASERVDAVDISTPRETHDALIRAVADRGIPILCEKPLGSSLEEAERLAAHVDTRTRLMVHENWRFRPSYRRIREWIARAAPGSYGRSS